jgi:curved DNA-binding protein
MEFKDYYKTLGLSRDAKPEDIKRAYRRLARKYHPDVSTENDAEARFKEVAEAYEVLKVPEKRKAYDQFGKDWKAGQDFKTPPGWEREFVYEGEEPAAGGGEPYSDFFESLFGAGRGGFGGFDRGFGERAARGRDTEVEISIRLEDSYQGATQNLRIEMPEVDEQGQYRARTRDLKVKIPKGVREGQRIRIEGQGGSGRGGTIAGDLYLRVKFKPHKQFEARGSDIHLMLPVTPWQAALGRTAKVPTLGGKVDLKIPAGSSSGKRLRLRGRGLPGKPPGDQYVELQIRIPAHMDDETRSLYEQLEARASTHTGKAQEA